MITVELIPEIIPKKWEIPENNSWKNSRKFGKFPKIGKFPKNGKIPEKIPETGKTLKKTMVMKNHFLEFRG